MERFRLITKNKPAGDQPKAIRQLVAGLKKGYRHQTLLGVTGSGKTFTVANVIAAVGKPALVIAHNKTLAAQLCNEFRELFPHNAVHYFVSYYDYYQPEAYLPTTDTYIGKEALINEEIDRLRHAATTALLTRRDVIIVASVSCIYGLGAPEVYSANILHFKVGDRIERGELIRKLVEMQFRRTNADLKRGTFRLRGDNWEIMPPNGEIIYNFSLADGKIRDIFIIDPVKGFNVETPRVSEVFVSPARHFITLEQEREEALKNIEKELRERLAYFEKRGKYLEAERLERRVRNDIAMIREVGYCNGIENYSRHLSGRLPGEPPATLLDYFPRARGLTQMKNPRGSMRIKEDNLRKSAFDLRKSAGQEAPDFLTIIDESHVTIPQLRGMYEGDISRKKTLVEYGFRLPSAVDNRPLRFDEFTKRIGQVIYTSATPGPYELRKSRAEGQVVEQIIRPTGLVDPKVVIRPAKGQIEDLLPRLKGRIENKERVLVTTLTKRMAEDLSDYLNEMGLRVAYLHSEVKTLERIRILTNLRRGNFDVLVGVNLLREGLDLPEVSLVAILDADKEGFLRSATSLIQTIGRAARNVRGEVLIYADTITGSIKKAVRETERRRRLQLAYNKKHKITPQTIVRAISDIIPVEEILDLEIKPLPKSKTVLKDLIQRKEKEMKEAAARLDFELAAILRDEIKALAKKLS
jgi:excinuclease ABC subunit B